MDLKPYIISLAIGLLVGVLYALLNTRSPAPPIIALLGLLGMLVGESLTSWAKSQMSFAKAAEHCLHAKDFSADGPEDPKAQGCEKTTA
ncbi:MAG: DUF1427 family protein [Pseudomonadota bacterium]